MQMCSYVPFQQLHYKLRMSSMTILSFKIYQHEFYIFKQKQFVRMH